MKLELQDKDLHRIAFTGFFFLHLLINFNGISFCLGLFYAKRLGNCFHCTFMFTFLSSYFLRGYFIAHGPIKYK